MNEMANPNKRGPAQKIEARSRTGGTYGKAGVRWTSDWMDVPKDLLDDEKRFKLLAEDLHVELRVDGKRIPKVNGDPGDPEPVKVDTSTSTDILELTNEIDRLHESLAKSDRAHDEQIARLTEAHDQQVAALNARIAELEAAAAKPAETKASDAKAPEAKSTDTKASKPDPK